MVPTLVNFADRGSSDWRKLAVGTANLADVAGSPARFSLDDLFRLGLPAPDAALFAAGREGE